MQHLAFAIVLIPFAGAACTAPMSFATAKWIAQAFALATFAAVLALAYAFASSGTSELAIDLVTVGSATVLGVLVDRISVLIIVAVVGVGLLVCVY